MAKRKKKKTRADKEVEVKGAKETAGLAEKKSATHKPIEAKPRPKPKPKAKAKTKAKPKTKSKSKSNIPAVIESSLEQTDKPVDISKEVDIGKPDSEILIENLEAPQTDDQIGDVTEAVLEADAETGSLEEKERSIQTEDGQASIVVEAENTSTAKSINQEAVDIQTDNLTDDLSETVVDTTDTSGIATEKKDDSQADKQTDDPTKVEVPQTDDQTEEITEAILEAAAETERLTEEEEKLQTEDEQTSILVEAEDSVTAESISQKTEDIQTDKPADDVSESAVEGSVEAQNLKEESDDTRTGDQPGDVIEDTGTTKSSMEKVDDNQAGEEIEVAPDVEKLAEEVDGLQTEDEQTGIIVEAEDSDMTESLIQEAEETQKDELTEEVSGSVVEDTVDAGNLTEEIDDTKTDDQSGDVNEEPDTKESSMEKADDTDTLKDNQAGEVTEEEAVGKSILDRIKKLLSGESKTVVDRVKKFLSRVSQIGSKAGDSTEKGIENHAETEMLTKGTDDAQDGNVVKTVIENPEPVENFTESADDTLTDKQVGDADEEVVGCPDSVANDTRKADDTQIDSQVVFASEANVEGSDDEIQTAVFSDNKRHRTKKAGIIISVFIVTAAVILLIVASIERRSAKSALVQISKVAESIKQMQWEILKEREQVTRSQIESKELV
ncbi:MAG: hypothetical protein ACUZ9M_05545, partial [Candidatus Scalindua sp.]